MARKTATPAMDADPLWYKDAIIYQTHVRAFHDSNGDGIGDFAGLTAKLDYLRDLGVSAVWILPFYPSPLRDDGYDIADYTDVNPAYGSLADVRAFVRAAHRRGLRVITELVCNHTSDQHPWFQRARRAKPGSVYRDFYVWSDTPERYRDARIIFKDFETSNWSWDPVAQAYYWHRFYHHQPDLNFENPRVQAAIFRAMAFWLDMGIDGLRLDAVPYLYEAEGSNCENLPATHAFLKQLRAHVDREYPGRMLLAEANQWPEDAVAYFGEGSGDECNMSFHFPLMPRMFMSLRMEDRYPIIDILNQTPEIPETSQWAIFLRNHDELTLEMVTDEERDYMYRVYANDPQMRINLGIRRRLSPLLGNNRRRIELMNGLLFSLPGAPIIYYGDEIGMGDNIYLGDRNGVRTPMQWNSDRNAGFSSANRQRLYFPVIVDPEYHYEAVNVEAQQANPHSLLWWMKRLIALRKRHPAFSRGTLEFLHPNNRKVLAFVRRHEDETLLVVANLSRFVQGVELDLSAWQGLAPVEMFGQTEFPPVGESPYFITLGPHAFYWFSLPVQVAEQRASATGDGALLVLTVPGRWQGVTSASGRSALADLLPGWLPSRRWFAGKARRIKGVSISDVVPLAGIDLVFAQVEYIDGDPETYLLPIGYAPDETEQQPVGLAQGAIARLQTTDGSGLLYDAAVDPALGTRLLNAFPRRRQFRGERGALVAIPGRAFQALRGDEPLPEPNPGRAEQSNTSLVFGERLILKLLRKVEAGPHPDVEIGRALSEQVRFPHTATLAGRLEYQPERGDPATVGVLQSYVPNEGDAWTYALDALGAYWERVLSYEAGEPLVRPTLAAALAAEELETPPDVWQLIEPFLSAADTLGRRTAELHLALARIPGPEFAPEPFSMLYQRAVYQALRGQIGETWQLLRRQRPQLDPAAAVAGERLLALEDAAQRKARSVTAHKLETARIRTHGDYHLGQVLFTGSDFVIIDFEGEPANPLGQRRLKRSPLGDVAGMLRSFDYAAWISYANAREQGLVPQERALEAAEWARFWSAWVGYSFLRGYLAETQGAAFVPQSAIDLALLLDLFLLNKVAYELRYELNNRPDWVWVPLNGLLDLLETADEGETHVR